MAVEEPKTNGNGNGTRTQAEQNVRMARVMTELAEELHAIAKGLGADRAVREKLTPPFMESFDLMQESINRIEKSAKRAYTLAVVSLMAVLVIAAVLVGYATHVIK